MAPAKRTVEQKPEREEPKPKAKSTAADAAKKRPRSGATGSDIAEALDPVVRKKGRSWLKYDESPVVSKTKTLPDAIAAAGDILARLHAKWPQLCFRKRDVERAVNSIWERYAAHWGLADEYKADYVETMVRRLCNLCRTVAQAQQKKRPPEWTTTLPWKKKLPSEPSQFADEEGDTVRDNDDESDDGQREPEEVLDEEDAESEEPDQDDIDDLTEEPAQASTQALA